MQSPTELPKYILFNQEMNKFPLEDGSKSRAQVKKKTLQLENQVLPILAHHSPWSKTLLPT